jgi:hypothetical protein
MNLLLLVLVPLAKPATFAAKCTARCANKRCMTDAAAGSYDHHSLERHCAHTHRLSL